MNNSKLPFRLNAIVLAFMMGASEAATIKVNHNCSLTDAVTAANTDTATGGCPAGNGADILQLTLNQYVFTSPIFTQDDRDPHRGDYTALPLISSVITINGDPDGVGKRAEIRRESTSAFRLIQIKPSGNLTLNDTVLKNGWADKYNNVGGGILNAGVLTLKNSTLTKNTAPWNLYTYSGSHSGLGGAIFNSAGGKATLLNSTISGNTAIASCFFSDLINNSYEPGRGGGIFNRGILNLRNSTVSNNMAQDSKTCINDYCYCYIGAENGGMGIGGGIFNTTTGKTTLTNSVIANSRKGADCVGTIIFQGVNLIEDGSCNITPPRGLSGDPKLMPLTYNGGSTPTHAPSPDSIVINRAVDYRCTPTDQRGVLRPDGMHCDLGAVEYITSVNAPVKPILDFFDASLQNNELSGVGKYKAIQVIRLSSFRNQLVTTGSFLDHNLKNKACFQINILLKSIDPNNTPDLNDLVTGNAGSGLTDKINSLKISSGC